ncbi:polymorphic toxin-type HINT domain-containing protein [Paenibacillus sanguinis]|uniref:polymorphic toxin-type HINT domain-containing protein n=1 Tax=Paenibacillus sanguinis TaxID=225906 RepID=UPI00037FBF1F|nr:polymorphic toxin-type HINT domain-containing protein [Paenibacillus sanguinis]
MWKKVIGFVLSLSLMGTGMFQTVSFGAGTQLQTTPQVAERNTLQGDLLTASGIMQKFKVSEAWVDGQLSQGYTLYQIDQALQQGKEGYASAIVTDQPVRHMERELALLSSKSSLVPDAVDQGEMAALPLASAAIYDQAALEQLSLLDESSLYELSYGEDAVAASTGDVRLRIADLTLPGSLSFTLTRMYDSSRASEEIGVALENGAYVNQTKARREERDSALGRGWRWALPFVEEREGQQILDFPGIGRYRLTADLKLQGYPWGDVILMEDGTQTVGELKSTLKLSVLNGHHYYFSASGHLILITDNYGNRVELRYTPGASHGATVLSSIQNSDGQELTFTYTAGRMTVALTGTPRKVEYVTAVAHEQPVLSEVKDALGRSTKYVYDYPESRYNFLATLKEEEALQPVKHSALLRRVMHPGSGTTELDYTPALKHLGEYATEVVFKVKARKSLYSTPLGDVALHPAAFTYSGEDLTSYGQDASWTTTVVEADATSSLKIRKSLGGSGQPDLLYLDEQQRAEASTTYRQQYRYDTVSGWNLPIQVTESYQQGGSESSPLSVTYQYNERGQVLAEQWSTGQEQAYEYTASAEPYFWSLPQQAQTQVNAGQKRVERYRYNAQGSLLQVAVRENSASGKLLAQTDWTYDAYGHPATVIVKDDARTNLVNYTYASPYGKHLLTKQSMLVHAASGSVSKAEQKFSYGPAGELLTAADEAGAVTAYTYDALGRMIQTLYSDQSTTQIAYDDDRHTVTVTGPEGITTLEQYNPFGLLMKQVLGEAIFEYTYDEAGNLTEHTDAEQNRTRYTYDGFGRPTKTLYADGSQDVTTYDMVNRTVTYQDPAGVQYREQLDLLGNTLAVEEGKGGAFVTLEQSTYNLEGHPVTVTDGKGQQTTYQVDALGRVVAITDPEQRVTKYTYSLAGDLIRVDYPDGTSVKKEYNEVGQLILQTNEQGRVEAYYYDTRGNLVRFLDHANKLTNYEYNKDNVLTKITTPDQTIAYTYDAMGRRTGMTDGTGSTTYSYDPSDGALTGIRYPDGARIDYDYNKQMRTGYTFTDASGRATGASYTVDPMNRVSALEVVQRAAGASRSAGDAVSSLASRAVPSVNGVLDRMTFDYQANGLLQQGASENGPGTSYRYDGYDLTGMTIEAGAMARAKQAASLAGELGADTTGVNEATDASLSGEAAALDRPGFSQGGMGQERNDEGQLGKSTGAQATETEAATEPTVTEATYALSTPRVATGHSFTYQYDRNKNITGRTQNVGLDVFTYEVLNRIQQESGLSGSKKYAYDPRGNIQQVEGRTLRGLTDANFTFDSLNQLTQVKLENGKEVSYTYNGDGLLYERVEGDQRTRYYYDEEAKLIAEAEVKGGAASVSYTYIYDLGGRLWSRVDQATSGVQYYELNDHGDVVGLFQKQADEIYYVHIGDEIIEVTGEHPFWLDGKGWTFVKDLRVGDLLVSSDGSKLAIDKIEKEPREATVYNFEVAGFSSYFVSNLGIWVHNCSIFGFKVADVPNMSKSQLLGNLPDGWKYTDNNGFVHV